MKYLHSAPLPEASQPTDTNSLGQQLSELGLLNEDSAAVESISSEAADLTLDGQFNWGPEFSSLFAHELDELADANMPALPLYSRDGEYANSGWYSIKSAEVDPLHANRRDVWSYTLSLTFSDSQGSSFRALSVGPRQADHPWGNDLQELVAVPASAGKVRWYHSTTGREEPASPVDTRSGEHVDADLYDISAGEDALGVDSPTVIYDVSYEDDVRGGVRAYDTRGHTAKYAGENGSGPRQWQTIHSTEHDISEPVVVSNGQVRVRLDETGAPALSADSWDSSTASWTAVDALETEGSNTDWTLYDIDIMDIGLSVVDLQLEFQHPTEGLYNLDAGVQFGREAVLFERPDGASGPVPAGLEDWLGPVAAGWLMDPQQSRTLVSREGVRA